MSTEQDKLSEEDRRELVGRLKTDEERRPNNEQQDEFVTDWDKQVSELYDGRSGP